MIRICCLFSYFLGINWNMFCRKLSLCQTTLIFSLCSHSCNELLAATKPKSSPNQSPNSRPRTAHTTATAVLAQEKPSAPTQCSVEGLCQGKSTHAWRFMPQCCTCRPGIWRHSLNHGFEVRFGVQRTWLWRIYNQPRWTINRWSSIWSGNNCRQSKLFFLLIKRAFIDVCHPCPSLSPRRHSFLFCEIVACNY